MILKTQKMYSENDKDRISISPYAKIFWLNNKQIQIFREDKGTYIVITASDLGTLQYLVEMLNLGTDRKQLIQLLKNLSVKNPTAWIDLCQRKGMIE